MKKFSLTTKGLKSNARLAVYYLIKVVGMINHTYTYFFTVYTSIKLFTKFLIYSLAVSFDFIFSLF
ncbi:hypothetical protein THF1C08_100054 [Vibrio jasicida]|uniref:Uncharacterized protein n=1 Tax=Vibrio jasicida TaxID=766224 RepID=A0AAU9R1M3_9VIBR|nr:hypothetical protein THF1C08_100054 [Vibrio jasicida]CAH1603950.1 hypothetical protein THF1A12_90054 [Vibrio jasicida]